MSTIIPQAGNLTVILSAELDWRDDERNLAAHVDLRNRLGAQLSYGELFSVQVCEGAYKGIPERSIAITGPVSRTLAIGRKLGKAFVQESILAIDHDGRGKLVYVAIDHSLADDDIGTYSPLHGAVDAWTRVLATGETFTFI